MLIGDLNQKMVEVFGRLENLERKVDKQCNTSEAIENSTEFLAAEFEELLTRVSDQQSEIAELKKTSELQQKTMKAQRTCRKW